MKSLVTKRSVVIDGRKTSVSLEEPFWQAVQAIAAAERTPVASLLRKIDHDRQLPNLSSAIRIFVLDQVRAQAAAARPKPQQPCATTCKLTAA
jgi:predicted DNA-binding ribbon-helix-helix protein